MVPTYRFAVAGSPTKIPSDASLAFEVELIGWVEKTLEDMHDGEKLEHAQGVRAAGAAHFAEKEWSEARHMRHALLRAMLRRIRLTCTMACTMACTMPCTMACIIACTIARTKACAMPAPVACTKASAKFREGIEHLDKMGEAASKASEARAALLSCLLNQAQCCLKLGG